MLFSKFGWNHTTCIFTYLNRFSLSNWLIFWFLYISKSIIFSSLHEEMALWIILPIWDGITRLSKVNPVKQSYSIFCNSEFSWIFIFFSIFHINKKARSQIQVTFDGIMTFFIWEHENTYDSIFVYKWWIYKQIHPCPN